MKMKQNLEGFFTKEKKEKKTMITLHYFSCLTWGYNAINVSNYVFRFVLPLCCFWECF